MDIERLAHLARLSEDALRSAATDADPDEADALTDRASERASQVEQLRALDRPHGATAEALAPSAHGWQTVAACEHALGDACAEFLADPATSSDARALAATIAASCRR